MSWLVAVLALPCLGADEYPGSPPKTLVIHETRQPLADFSLFFAILKDRHHTLDFVSAYSPELRLRDEATGARLFDNAVVLADGVEEFGGNLSAAELAEFVDAGGAVVLATSSRLGDTIADFAQMVGFEFDEAGTAALDHAAQLDSDPRLFATDRIAKLPLIVGDRPAAAAPLLFRGVALRNNPDNALALELATGTTTTYSYSMAEGMDEGSYPFAVGGDTVLVGAMQARNNARVLLLGSLDALSNALMTDPRGANTDFIKATTAWTLGAVGKLEVFKWHVSALDNDGDGGGDGGRAAMVAGRGVLVCAEVLQEHDYGVPVAVAPASQYPARFTAFDQDTGGLLQLHYTAAGDARTVLVRPDLSRQGQQCAELQLALTPGTHTLLLRHSGPGYSNLLSTHPVVVRPPSIYRAVGPGALNPATAPFRVGAWVMLAGTGVFTVVLFGALTVAPTLAEGDKSE